MHQKIIDYMEFVAVVTVKLINRLSMIIPDSVDYFTRDGPFAP